MVMMGFTDFLSTQVVDPVAFLWMDWDGMGWRARAWIGSHEDDLPGRATTDSPGHQQTSPPPSLPNS